MESVAKFFYDELDTLSRWGGFPWTVSPSNAQNLNPRYELYHYQMDAFARFIHCYNNDFLNKTYPHQM